MTDYGVIGIRKFQPYGNITGLRDIGLTSVDVGGGLSSYYWHIATII